MDQKGVSCAGSAGGVDGKELVVREVRTALLSHNCKGPFPQGHLDVWPCTSLGPEEQSKIGMCPLN